METKNFIDAVFMKSINIMATDNWEWPAQWDMTRKLKFLKDPFAFELVFWLFN